MCWPFVLPSTLVMPKYFSFVRQFCDFGQNFLNAPIEGAQISDQTSLNSETFIDNSLQAAVATQKMFLILFWRLYCVNYWRAFSHATKKERHFWIAWLPWLLFAVRLPSIWEDEILNTKCLLNAVGRGENTIVLCLSHNELFCGIFFRFPSVLWENCLIWGLICI